MKILTNRYLACTFLLAATSSVYANPDYNTVGKLRSETGSCTGVLVGERLMLTNSHCVAEENRLEQDYYIFDFQSDESHLKTDHGFVDWEDYRSSQRVIPLKAFHYQENFADEEYDFALLLLHKKLGATRGYVRCEPLGDITKAHGKLKNPISIIHVGHTPNIAPYGRMQECSIREIREKSFLDDCSSVKGDSGSPMFYRHADGTYSIIGVMWGGSGVEGFSDVDYADMEKMRVPDYDDLHYGISARSELFCEKINALNNKIRQYEMMNKITK